ncbi:MAG: Mov34/MPN/PAD-1 family protein [Nitrososphaeraceae archaeon]
MLFDIFKKKEKNRDKNIVQKKAIDVNFKKKQVHITRQTVDGIITYAKTWHPNEGILILKGKSTNHAIIINGLIIPPFSSHGPYYSGFPINELPLDLSYIGTVHSHPSNSNEPSLEDLNNFYGIISLIICHPYEVNNLDAFDRNGKKYVLKII